MGRKIQKSRRHKKLKPVDPFNFKAREENKHNSKYNQPPTSNEQEIPRSFRELFLTTSANKATSSNATSPSTSKSEKKTKRKKNEDEFVKRKWESERQFLNRINRETHEFVNDQLHKIKYGLLEKEVPTLEKDEEKLTRKEQRILSQRKEKNSSGSTTLPLKIIKKKRKKKEVDALNVKDFVQFGERVDAPPILTVAPKKLKRIDASSKAGKKDLLLKNLYDNQSAKLTPFPAKSLHTNDGTIKCDDVKKRKMLTEERSRVIEAYRNLKYKKQKVVPF